MLMRGSLSRMVPIPRPSPIVAPVAAVRLTAKVSDSDYVAQTGTLTFAPGETTKTITIEVKADSKKEARAVHAWAAHSW